MELYEEKDRGTVLIGRILRILAIVQAVPGFVFGIVLYLHDKDGENGPMALFILVLYSGIAAPAVLVGLTLLGLFVVRVARVTRDEIIFMPLLAKWFTRLAWKIPIQSINGASLANYASVVERLKREAACPGVRITCFQGQYNSHNNGFWNVSLVDGEGIPLRVCRRNHTERGIMLEMNDGTSVFLGFDDPAAALAAIQEAMRLVA